MIRLLYKKYWAVGFGSRLYDLLSPQAYRDSIAMCVESVRGHESGVWLDAGCGSGLSLAFLKDRLRKGGRYYGMDLTASGLARVREKVKALDINGCCVRADFTKGLPFKESSVGVVVAHFSTYTASDNAARLQALKNFHAVLKPGGTLALANPSKAYDGKRIIGQSLERIREEGPFMFLAKKFFLYPLALWFGLRFIERQLRHGFWKAYDAEELCSEMRSAGFAVKHRETVYAGCGYLVIGEKSG